MKLDGALLLIDRNPERAKAILTKLADEVAGTVDDVRRLVDDLQPSVLAEIGLVAAVTEQARAFTGPVESGGALTVEVQAPAHLHGLAPVSSSPPTESRARPWQTWPVTPMPAAVGSRWAAAMTCGCGWTTTGSASAPMLASGWARFRWRSGRPSWEAPVASAPRRWEELRWR